MTTIRFENITKSFGATAVIKKLDLTIHQGEFFTFVGPSGCGKSTILHMIAGLVPPSSGRIFFDDRPVNPLSPKERDIALVFQSYALYPHMTVHENLAFPLVMKKEKKSVIDADVNRIAELLAISEFLRKKPKELSGGQRQRVALGRAIIRRPKVFLMDEPLSNLDARLRIEMRAELKRLHQSLGITTVYVTHDQSEAMGLSDRLAVLNQGEIQQCDEPRTVYLYPANTFVAGFIGIPAMNFLGCSVVRKQPFEVECIGLRLSPRTARLPFGDSVLLGIRPEDIIAKRTGERGNVEMTVSLVEPEGAITWVELLWEKTAIRARAKQDDNLLPGDRCYVALPFERISVFETGSGARL